MVFKIGEGENRFYIIIAIIIILVVIATVILSTNSLNKAYIEDFALGDSWFEDIDERKEKSQLFGLENWASFTYKNNNYSYPAYVTVTSIKLLFTMNEDDLLKKTEETIKKASDKGIVVDINTKISGEREIYNGHKSRYVIYNGSDTSKEPSETIKIIGETWNCGNSGTSIISIGFAQISDNSSNSSKINNTYWEKIIGLLEGLIYNIKCH